MTLLNLYFSPINFKTLIMIKKLFYLTVIAVTFSSCKTAIVPIYVSSGELASLNTGMTKEEAKTKLGNTSPFDILMAENSGCELHQYKYKKPAKMVSSSDANSAQGLTEGNKMYIDESDAFILYKNGKLESVLTNVGKKDAVNLLSDISSAHKTCSEAGLKGCTDPSSLTYNPSAVIDDGSCEYCPCGFTANPNFNDKRKESDCNKKCIKIESNENSGDEGSGNKNNSSKNESTCSDCDIIDKLSKSNANITINLKLDGNSGSRKKSSSVEIQKIKTPKAPKTPKVELKKIKKNK